MVGVNTEGQSIVVLGNDQKQVTGVTMETRWRSFAELVDDSRRVQNGTPQTWKLKDLELPFNHLRPKTLGLGLTYEDHGKEVDLSGIVLFEKNAEPTRLSDFVIHRDFLDYEAEVALLLHRHEPDVYGFLMHNDLTDRHVQALNFEEKNPGPGFSQAKSFPSSNAYGTLMAVGDEKFWKSLAIDLYWNRRKVQTVRPSQNMLKPKEIHKMIFEESDFADGHDWVLVGTGTPKGTIFYSPTLAQKAYLYVISGFSVKRAAERWVRRFNFIAPTDRLLFNSNFLGAAETRFQR